MTTESSNPENEIEPNFQYEILPEDCRQYDLTFKVIVIGDSGVGKSSLTNKATNSIFSDKYNATVGFEFFTFNIKMFNKIVRLQIWDTCGQELYRSLITNFYRNSSLAIIVYAINEKSSFEDIDMWLRDLRKNSNPDAKVFLIANKIDLEKDRKISKEEGQKIKDDNKLDLFMESSAKNGINAQNIFIQAAKMLLQDYLKYKGGDLQSEQITEEVSVETIELSTKRSKKHNSVGGCC